MADVPVMVGFLLFPLMVLTLLCVADVAARQLA